MASRLGSAAILLTVALVSITAIRATPAAMSQEPRDYTISVKLEEPGGYAGNPSSLLTPLRQDLTEITLHRREDGKYDIKLGPDAAGPSLEAIDLKTFIPRIPSLAAGNKALTREAISQREFNRNETRYGPTAGTDDFRIANNCLRAGLWEVMLAKKQESGLAMNYHGWFTFPKQEYARLFEEVNGVSLAKYDEFVATYPAMGGFRIDLTSLRKLDGEVPAIPVVTRRDQAALRLSEQQRKAKLVLTPGIANYGDFFASDKQPVQMAKFAEPGYYNPAEPMKFDLTWIAKPIHATWGAVHSKGNGTRMNEVQIAFENGYRLVIGDAGLGTLAARAEPPKSDGDALKLTFGIGTPEIYLSGADRAKEYAEPRDNYLLLLDADGKVVDNHLGGIDRAFLWRESGATDTLHVMLIGYERIAIVSDLTLPWRGDAPDLQ